MMLEEGTLLNMAIFVILSAGMTVTEFGPALPVLPGLCAWTGTGIELFAGITAWAVVANRMPVLPGLAEVETRVPEGMVSCCDPLLVKVTLPTAGEFPCGVVPVALPWSMTLAS